MSSFLINPYVFADAGTDPYFANVVALLHFDGTDGSTSMVDVTGRTWTAFGSAQLDTSVFKFGGASLLLDRALETDYISTAHSSDFSADVDFTCEFWVNPDVFVPVVEYMVTKRNGTLREWSFYLVGGGLTLAVFNSAGGQEVNLIGATSIPINTQTHVAWTRQGNTFRLFVGGILDASVTTAAFVYGYNTDPLSVGLDPGITTRFFGGHIDDLRITRGVARYTANFTPPAAPFPNS